MPPNMPLIAGALQYIVLDIIGQEKGRNPFVYWVNRPLSDYIELYIGGCGWTRTTDPGIMSAVL